eukprot:8651011-Pyramimonas_sp.AAC.1
MYNDLVDTDEYLLSHSFNPLFQQSSLYQLDKVCRMLDSLPKMPEDPEKKGFQAQVLKRLQQLFPGIPCCEALLVRSGYFLGPQVVSQANVITLQIKLGRVGQNVPNFIMSSVIKSMCNAWSTTRRYHHRAEGCRFGCANVGGDDVCHYVKCPVSEPTVLELLPLLQGSFQNLSGPERLCPHVWPGDLDTQ